MAQQHSNWVEARQKVVAANIAHADTPGFRGSDVAPFASLMSADAKPVGMATTHAGHMVADGSDAKIGVVARDSTGISLESEMAEISAVRREHGLNTAIVKSFHRLYLTSIRG
ncbi:flagellar basal body protein [Ahrensia sp. R2A130]|uniref:flagellar basal body protein n=1 Tax=Ahrensia sp. R2A130 TaxID=744979 RepID=UPI0012EA4ECC|nr:flagellar basal body protein [Ahrensia sp. R2A130]